jgi:hypothetical protein
MIKVAAQHSIAPSPVEFMPVRPELQERFLARFHLAAKAMMQQPREFWDAAIRLEVEWAISASGNPGQQAMYQSVWLLLRDLIHVGWTPFWDEQTATFEVAPPPTMEQPRTPEEIAAHKQMRRDVMRPERMTRLQQARATSSPAWKIR